METTERKEILLEATVNTWPNTFSSINYQTVIKVFTRNGALNLESRGDRIENQLVEIFVAQSVVAGGVFI